MVMVMATVAMATAVSSSLNEFSAEAMTKSELSTTKCFKHTQLVVFAVFLMMLAVSAESAWAQSTDAAASVKPALSIVPRVSISETATDNVRLTATDRQFELVTVVSPGIRISGDRGRLKGYFDYELNARYFSQNTSGADTQNALTAFGTFEAVENWAFVDFNAGISQQSVSALAAPLIGSTALNGIQNESTTVRLSPYLRGRLSDTVDYEARYSFAVNRNNASTAFDTNSRDGSIRLSGRGAGSRLGWSLTAQRQNIAFSNGRDTESDLVTGDVIYAVLPKVTVSLSVGRDSNNFTSVEKESAGTFGYGVTWIPSETTSFSAAREHRRVGESFNLNAFHRTARTVWRFTDSRSIANPAAQTGLANLGSAFGIFFDQFADTEPDPVRRATLVNSFLLTNGIDPNSSVTANFATSAASLLRRQDLSFSLLGIRDTITFIATRSEASRVDTLSSAVDDLSNGAVVRQAGLSVSLAHKLTPRSSMNLLLSSSQSSDSLNLQENTSRLLNLSFLTRLGPRSTAALSARHVVFDSNINPYTESAVTGTFSVQF